MRRGAASAGARASARKSGLRATRGLNAAGAFLAARKRGRGRRSELGAELGEEARAEALATLKHSAAKSRGVVIRQGIGLGALYACAALHAPDKEKDKIAPANTHGPSAKAARPGAARG